MEFALILQKFNAEILLIGLAVSLITQFIKRYIPEKFKDLVKIFPFLIGLILSVVYALIVKRMDLAFIFSCGIQSGAVATIYYALSKQLSKKDATVCVITSILKGLISAEDIKGVAKEIAEILSESHGDVKEVISKLICANSLLDSEEGDMVAQIIIKSVVPATVEGGE